MFDLRPLRSSSFRHVALGYWVNEFGNWIGEIALTVLVYDRTRNPLETAALFLALQFVPALFAPFLTARIETVAPRVALAGSYALEALLFAGLAGIAKHFSMPLILVLSILDGILSITAKALTRSAIAAELGKRNLLREGNGILNLGLMSSTACAPVVAGALVAWDGPRSALLVDAATFLLTALIIATAVDVGVASDASAAFFTRVRKGAETIRSRGAVRRLMGALAFGWMLSAVPIPIEVVFAKHTLHAGDLGYGLLLGSWGAGMVLGGIVFTLITSVRLIRIVGVGAVAIAIGYGGLALAPSLAVACVASCVGGAGNGAGWVAAMTSVQERIPMNTQTAVMTLLEGLNQIMPAVGFVVGGALTAATSPRVAYGLAAVGVALVLLATTVWPIDQVTFTDSPPPGPQAGEREFLEEPAPEDSTVIHRNLLLPISSAG